MPLDIFHGFLAVPNDVHENGNTTRFDGKGLHVRQVVDDAHESVTRLLPSFSGAVPCHFNKNRHRPCGTNLTLESLITPIRSASSKSTQSSSSGLPPIRHLLLADSLSRLLGDKSQEQLEDSKFNETLALNAVLGLLIQNHRRAALPL